MISEGLMKKILVSPLKRPPSYESLRELSPVPPDGMYESLFLPNDPSMILFVQGLIVLPRYFVFGGVVHPSNPPPACFVTVPL